MNSLAVIYLFILLKYQMIDSIRCQLFGVIILILEKNKTKSFIIVSCDVNKLFPKL